MTKTYNKRIYLSRCGNNNENDERGDKTEKKSKQKKLVWHCKKIKHARNLIAKF